MSVLTWSVDLNKIPSVSEDFLHFDYLSALQNKFTVTKSHKNSSVGSRSAVVISIPKFSLKAHTERFADMCA